MSTLTTILGPDIVRDSRADINANFAALNADKVEAASPSLTGVVSITGNSTPLDVRGTFDGATTVLLRDNSAVAGTSSAKVLFNSGGTDVGHIRGVYDASNPGVTIGTGATTGVLNVRGSKVGIMNTAPAALLTIGTAGTTAGSLSLAGLTSGTATIVVASAAGTPTLTLPTVTGTLQVLGTFLTLGAANIAAPANTTTYYVGNAYSSSPQTAEPTTRIYIPKACVLKAAYVYFNVSGTVGSNQQFTVSVRLNNTTDTTITSTMTADNGSGLNVGSNTGLSVALVAGDFISLKFVTPTWGTLPTNLRVFATLYFENA